jgi:hypothetical protein
MRSMIRHAVALLFLGFLFKIAFQAQEYKEFDGVPKSLILSSLAPEQPIPSGRIDTHKIIAAIRKE